MDLAESYVAATNREFLLYWAGIVVLALSGAAVLMTISGLIIDVLHSGCWYPVLSPMLGVERPTPYSPYPSYCPSPVVAVIRFVFTFLADLIFAGVAAYMALNGRRR